jgi:Cu-Zn family superoxide dismutase
MRIAPLAAAAGIAFGIAACATTAPAPVTPAQVPGEMHDAVANLASASGSLVSGRIQLMSMGGGVHVAGDIGGLVPGSSHGFHIHEKGDCSAADGSSAGGHFNPSGSPHGRAGHGAHHAGDMDNIVADGEGVAHVNMHVSGVTLGDGGIDDIVGRALVVHGDADDYVSQPSGDAGARVACGVIALVD